MRITEPNYYRYYKRLGLFTKLATSYQRADRHEILGQKPPGFQLSL